MKTRPFTLTWPLAVVLVCSTVAAQAQSLRCRSDVIGVGESRASLLQKCGEPMLRDSFCKPASELPAPAAVPGSTTVNVLPCEKVDEWTYNPGYGQFMTTLRLESGRVTAIKYGDRVK